MLSQGPRARGPKVDHPIREECVTKAQPGPQEELGRSLCSCGKLSSTNRVPGTAQPSRDGDLDSPPLPHPGLRLGMTVITGNPPRAPVEKQTKQGLRGVTHGLGRAAGSLHRARQIHLNSPRGQGRGAERLCARVRQRVPAGGHGVRVLGPQGDKGQSVLPGRGYSLGSLPPFTSPRGEIEADRDKRGESRPPGGCGPGLGTSALRCPAADCRKAGTIPCRVPATPGGAADLSCQVLPAARPVSEYL